MPCQDAIVDARRVKKRPRPLPSLVVPCCASMAILLVGCLVLNQDRTLIDESRILEERTQLHHKELFPFSTRDALGFFFATLGLMVAAGGGIGGGGLLVPIYILVLQFPAKSAIPLSNVTVFGGAVANTILNVRKRHPLADRPLIDWNIIMIMEPLTILGSLFGANLNKLLPEKAIVVLLVILLSLTAYKTLKKAVKLHETETYSMLEGQDANDKVNNDLELAEMGTLPIPAIPKQTRLTRGVSDSGHYKYKSLRQVYVFRRSHSLPLSPPESPEIDVSHIVTPSRQTNMDDESCSDLDLKALPIDATQNSARNPALARILEEERHTPTNYVWCIVSLFLFVLLVNILKGGGAFSSPVGIECGSFSFWIAEAAIVIVIWVVSCKARASLLHRTRLKRDVGYQYLDCDIEWNESFTFICPLLSWAAGFVAGLFGIGGGIIKGPLMLALGVHPAVASATSACMILFTSFTATTSFAVFGLLVKDYGIFCLITGFVATLLGQTVMSMIMARQRRSSYIAFCIGGVVLLSAICMTVESVISIWKGEGSGRSSGLCNSDF